MSVTDPHAPNPADSMPTTDTVGGESSLGAHVGLDDGPQRCVLIAVDERDESVDTARAALRLMGPNARYVLVNVGNDVLPWAADPAMWGMVPPAMVTLSPADGEAVRMGDEVVTPADQAEATAGAVAASAGLIDAETVGATGADKGGAICALAEEERADVIVIGQHHRSWLDRMFTRSVANDVLRNADRPILVVP